MKYLLFDTPSGVPTFRLFEDMTNHADVKKEVKNYSPGLTLLSAGKIYFTLTPEKELETFCLSGSNSLSIPFDKARSDEDTKIVNSLIKVSV